MASSAVVFPSSSKPSPSDDDGEYEIEYEEVELEEDIEVEEDGEYDIEYEEIEVEEEVEVEEDDKEECDVEAKHLKNGAEDELGVEVTVAEQEILKNGEKISKNNNQKTTNQSAVDGVCNTSPRLHAALIRLRSPLSSVECDRESKKLRIVCEFHAKGWCIRGNSCMFLHTKDGPHAVVKTNEVLAWEVASYNTCIPSLQSGKNPKLNTETEVLVLPKDGNILGVSLKDGGGSLRHNLHLDSSSLKGSSIARDDAYYGSSSTTSHDKNCDMRVCGVCLKMDETINKRSNIGPSDTRPAELVCSHTTQHLPFGSFSWNKSVHGPHKFLQSNLERHPSIALSMQRSTPSSRSKDALPIKYETIMSSTFEWEPSTPFLPSHEITRRLLLENGLYNPMCGRTNKKDSKVANSCSYWGSSIKNVNLQSNNPKEEKKLLNMGFASDAVKFNILSSSNGDKVKLDKPLDGTVLEVDGSGKINDVEYGFKGDDYVQSESQAFKYFRSALIKSVKELLMPTWSKGILSKVAHNLVAKKTVDKVLSTLQPHQIPSTPKSVKFYLSSNQPELAKLVEGYLNLYGKT